MRVLREKPETSPVSSVDPEQQYEYERDDAGAIAYDDDLGVPSLRNTTERKLVAKIDWRVIPLLCILYLLAFLDRINIGNANIFGLSTDLQLTGTKYNTALVIFFVPYTIFEIPSNIILKKLRPSRWLSLCCFLFGLASICQGLVSNYGGLLTTRFFLGLFETGMFPGCFYLIGMWYRREEGQRRYSFFFSSTTLAGAFGGLLAAAIGKMDYMRGYRGWRWIFILEGTLTCVVAIALFFLLPDFPEEAKWLTEEERAYVRARLQADQGKSARDRPITLRDVGRVFKDWKVFAGGLMYFGMIVPAYGYAYFSPTIIKNYGYSNVQTQLHSVPPWAAAFGFAMIIAYASDKTKHRFAFAVFPMLVCIAGFAIVLSVYGKAHRDTQYAALFLIAMGAYSAMPVVVCWFNMNLGGHHRRAVGTAWQVGFGNTGGFVAVYIFLTEDAPRFVTGYSVCLAMVCLSILSSIVYLIGVMHANRVRNKSARDVGLSETEKTELGDLSPDYRYLL